ncbi:hypothetical protein CNMCM5793_008724 [Aspergillus hiratsukae]|uniref:Uncharacterized protein n=1 Tax=Aspergillus hiratsukae TaxID=1194566 RepID=A0A8H6P0M9_9EURO|nr:hypothetical protein CNMCM5793_008724 [Aspergillus hiratsukae]
MSNMEDPILSAADLLLLERWQEDSPLSPDAQREQIFAEFMTLGVDGQQRGFRWSVLTPEERGTLERVRQPVPERIREWTPWLRTCYEPSTDAAFSRIVDRLEYQFGGQIIILNDPALYNFGPDWHKIFLRIPQLLEYWDSAEGYHERLQEALREESDFDEELEDNIKWEDEGDYLYYYWALVVGRMHIVDKTTLASEGRNAGKVRIVWFDACGRVVGSYRAELGYAADITAVDNPMLDEHSCWVHGKVGKEFNWGAPLGPPYDQETEHDGDDSEGSVDADE